MYKLICYAVIIVNVYRAIGLEPDDISTDIPSINAFEIGNDPGTLHIVFSTECDTHYFSYQTLALMYTYNKVGQEDKITRLISCNPGQIDTISDEDLSLLDTLIVPNWSQHPRLNDTYPGYNRPIALIHWLAKAQPDAEWTLILDPDMLFMEEFKLKYFDVPEGWIQSAYYNYLDGTHNEMAQKYLSSNINTLNDTYGGTYGRLADEASYFVLIRTKDLAKILPDWLSLTEEIRLDEHIYEYNVDSNLKPNERTWIAEMYGLVFSAAKNNLRFKIEPTIQEYPESYIYEHPILLHYGLNHSVGEFYFDKHNYNEFNAFMCPTSQNASFENKFPEYGFFPHPPHPDTLNLSENIHERYGDLLVIHFANTLNLALCERHKSKCMPSSDIIDDACEMADAIDISVKQKLSQMDICQDDDLSCEAVKQNQLCEEQWMSTMIYCRVSCDFCRTKHQQNNNVIQNEEIKLNKEFRVSRHGDNNGNNDMIQEKYINAIQEEMDVISEHNANSTEDGTFVTQDDFEVKEIIIRGGGGEKRPEIRDNYIRFEGMEIDDVLTEREKQWQVIQYKNSYLMFVMLFLLLIYGLVKMASPNNNNHYHHHHRRYVRRFGNSHVHHEH